MILAILFTVKPSNRQMWDIAKLVDYHYSEISFYPMNYVTKA